MIITVCGSMQFHKEMIDTKDVLTRDGNTVHIPSGAYDHDKNEAYMDRDEDKISVKVEYDLIREHFRLIEGSDAILVLNYDKKGIKNYIGGNTFLEMGLAFWLKKKIYVLNPVPEMDYLTEMHAMQPIILNGDLNQIS